MSDYYYFEDKESEWGYTPVLGDDYIMAIENIAKRKGVKITDVMILDEIFHKTRKRKKLSIKGRKNELNASR